MIQPTYRMSRQLPITEIPLEYCNKSSILPHTHFDGHMLSLPLLTSNGWNLKANPVQQA